MNSDLIKAALQEQDYTALLKMKRHDLVAYYMAKNPGAMLAPRLRPEWVVRELIAQNYPLPNTLNRKLDQLAENYQKAQSLHLKAKIAFEGETVIERLWHGKLYQVRLKGKEFHYAGQAYPSLSAVARAITGIKWSGPVFFGLAKVKRK